MLGIASAYDNTFWTWNDDFPYNIGARIKHATLGQGDRSKAQEHKDGNQKDGGEFDVPHFDDVFLLLLERAEWTIFQQCLFALRTDVSKRL